MCGIWLLWWLIVTPFRMQASSIEFNSKTYEYAIKECNSDLLDRPNDWEQVQVCNQAALKEYLESNKGVQGIIVDALKKSTASDIALYVSFLTIPPLVLYAFIRFFVWLVLWILKGFT
jgi:hypothetical protein